MISALSDGGSLHHPVLLEEVLEALVLKQGGLFVDCTLGGGGHAVAILDKGGNDARLIGIDRDAEAILRNQKRFELYGGRVELIDDRYEEIRNIVGGRKADGILLDLGVSSFMLDDSSRGFSFQKDGPLDMRMDRSQKLSAKDIVNRWSGKDLASIFKKYGEEPMAGRVASAIEQARAKEEITRTIQLAEIIKSALPYKHSRVHPATKVFQAIRIAVNGELDNLEETLRDAVSVLKTGGRLAVISFHSLEDRIVKQTFAALSKGCECPPGFPKCICGKTPLVKRINKKPLKAKGEEVDKNRRARSALLRVVEKLAA